MDIGTHLITGLVVSAFAEEPVLKVAAVVGALAPDISMIPIYIHRYQIKKDWMPWKYLGAEGHVAPPHSMMKFYYFCHSFLFLGLMFLIGWSMKSATVFMFSLGYLSHLLWDIPTHAGEWSLRLFYPLSSFQISGIANWWKNKHFVRGMIPVWILLLVIYYFIR